MEQTLPIDVVNTKGDKVSALDLPASIFGLKRNTVLVHEVVTAHLANKRHGTHSTKTRGEVSGGGIKPWKQKHTGNARAGSNRSPLWRHGGIAFGPKPHQGYHQPIPAAKRRLALKIVLSDRLKEGRIRVVDEFQISEPKTKRFTALVKTLGLPKKSVLVVDRMEPLLVRASRNVSDVCLYDSRNLNSYDVLSASQVMFTRLALEQVTQRLEGKVEA
jgi:large subunit ribosomal protein L4